jgi:hypothetical protein
MLYRFDLLDYAVHIQNAYQPDTWVGNVPRVPDKSSAARVLQSIAEKLGIAAPRYKKQTYMHG